MISRQVLPYLMGVFAKNERGYKNHSDITNISHRLFFDAFVNSSYLLLFFMI